jgi:hypothetical protein
MGFELRAVRLQGRLAAASAPSPAFNFPQIPCTLISVSHQQGALGVLHRPVWTNF